jgi:hypothetical protein
MSLRIRKRSQLEGLEVPGEEADGWASRVAKLIPGEALGLYGTAAGLIDTNRMDPKIALGMVTVACCIITVMIRIALTRDPAAGRGPQIAAVAISLLSFLLWVAALGASGQGMSPFSDVPGVNYAPLAALLWGTLVPYFYKGE